MIFHLIHPKIVVNFFLTSFTFVTFSNKTDDNSCLKALKPEAYVRFNKKKCAKYFSFFTLYNSTIFHRSPFPTFVAYTKLCFFHNFFVRLKNHYTKNYASARLGLENIPHFCYCFIVWLLMISFNLSIMSFFAPYLVWGYVKFSYFKSSFTRWTTCFCDQSHRKPHANWTFCETNFLTRSTASVFQMEMNPSKLNCWLFPFQLEVFLIIHAMCSLLPRKFMWTWTWKDFPKMLGKESWENYDCALTVVVQKI